MPVAVVGAGPYGLLYGLKLLRKGIETLVLEEHNSVGLPDHCAGLISANTLRLLGVGEAPVLSRVKGAFIYPPSGKHPLVVDSGKAVAVVVDRPRLDATLAEEFESEGGNLLTGKRVREVINTESTAAVRCGSVQFEADFVAIAVGAGRRLPVSVGFRKVEGMLAALQADVVGLDFEKDMVEVYLSAKLFPGLFGWLVPRGDKEARIGVVGTAPLTRLKLLIKKRAAVTGKVSRPRLVSFHGGLVITGGPLRVFHNLRVLLLGDAAGHTKPTTGGGLAFAPITTDIAVEATQKALEESREALAEYTKSWWRTLGSEVRGMLMLRRLLNSLSDEELEELLRVVKEAGFEEMAVGWGDMDRQGGLIIKAGIKSIGRLAKKPVLARSILLSLAKAFLLH